MVIAILILSILILFFSAESLCQLVEIEKNTTENEARKRSRWDK